MPGRDSCCAGQRGRRRGAIGRLRGLLRALRRAFPTDIPRVQSRQRLRRAAAAGLFRSSPRRVRRRGCPAIRAWTRASDACSAGRGYCSGPRGRRLPCSASAATPPSCGSQRRVIMKAEVVQYRVARPRRSALRRRAIDARAGGRLRVYRQRGTSESLQGSRTAWASGAPAARVSGRQFRVLLTATAYVLFQTLQQHAGHGLRRRPGRHPAERASQARGVDHPIGAPAGAAPATRLSLARRLARLAQAVRARAGNRSAASPARVHDRRSGLVAEPLVQRTACAPRRVLGPRRLASWPRRPSAGRQMRSWCPPGPSDSRRASLRE